MPPNKPDTRPTGAVHDSSLARWAVDEMRQRRGRQFAFEYLRPSRTASIAIDLMETYIAGTHGADPILRAL